LLDGFFAKSSNITFHENPSSGSRVVPWERADRWTDMTKLIAAFRDFAKAPKICHCSQITFLILRQKQVSRRIIHGIESRSAKSATIILPRISEKHTGEWDWAENCVLLRYYAEWW